MSESNDKKFNMDRVLDEIKNGKGLVMADWILRTISDRKERQIILDKLVDESNLLKDWLNSPGLKFSRSEAAGACDLDLLLNYEKAILNFPLHFKSKHPLDAQIAQDTQYGSNSSIPTPPKPFCPVEGFPDSTTKNAKEIDFYLVTGLNKTLDTYVSDLQHGLTIRKDPDTEDWLRDFNDCGRNILSQDGPVLCPTIIEVEVPNAIYAIDRFITSPVTQLLQSTGINVGSEPVRRMVDEFWYDPSSDKQLGYVCDIVIYEGSEKRTFIQVMPEGLHLYERDRMFARPETSHRSHYLHSILHQCCQILAKDELCICIISGYRRSYVVELAFDDEEWQATDQTSIPLRTYAIDVHGRGKTVQMVLAAILWHQCNLTVEEKRLNKESIDHLRSRLSEGIPLHRTFAPIKERTSEFPDKLLRWEFSQFNGKKLSFGIDETHRDHDYLHSSESADLVQFEKLQFRKSSSAIVLCTESKNIRKLFPTMSVHSCQPDHKLVVKLYDYNHLDVCFTMKRITNGSRWGHTTYDEYVEIAHKQALEEIRCYETIWKHNNNPIVSDRIRVPRLHDYGNLLLTRDNKRVVYEGVFILMDYVGEKVTSITESQYQDGVRQLRQMGKLHIHHNDVAARNLRVDDGDVIFIDFNYCKVTEGPVSNDKSIKALSRVLK